MSDKLEQAAHPQIHEIEGDAIKKVSDEELIARARELNDANRDFIYNLMETMIHYQNFGSNANEFVDTVVDRVKRLFGGGEKKEAA